MASLGEKLVHLSHEIEERKKSVELLTQLINDQSPRHASEIVNFEKEQNECLAKITREHSQIQEKMSNITEPLLDKKTTLENTVNELLAKHREAELNKMSNVESTKREISDAKELARTTFKLEKSQREKDWLDARVAEMNRLTWKGIEPNIERLVRKHKDQCEEIKSKSEYSKKKLELQFENDLADRVQAYQRDEQQSNAWINKRNEFAVLLAREQDEHTLNLKKLKDKSIKQEDTMKKLHSLQLEALMKNNTVALSKLKSSASVHQLAQNLIAKKRARQLDLEATLEHTRHSNNSEKRDWEESWIKASSARVVKKNNIMVEELLEWRNAEIDELIRRSVQDDMSCNERNVR